MDVWATMQLAVDPVISKDGYTLRLFHGSYSATGCGLECQDKHKSMAYMHWEGRVEKGAC